MYVNAFLLQLLAYASASSAPIIQIGGATLELEHSDYPLREAQHLKPNFFARPAHDARIYKITCKPDVSYEPVQECGQLKATAVDAYAFRDSEGRWIVQEVSVAGHVVQEMRQISAAAEIAVKRIQLTDDHVYNGDNNPLPFHVTESPAE